jgi:hypothetical protein
MMEEYPAALRHVGYDNKDLERQPVHLECENQCRSVIISKCIELYPECLAQADRLKYLPLHVAMMNIHTPVPFILFLIDSYPCALQTELDSGYLALHIECMYQRRPSIISKCIELYPEALAHSDYDRDLPLHTYLKVARSLSSTTIAILMIEKCPQALRRADGKCNLPLHIECGHLCRVSVISKCIELYPRALTTGCLFGLTPFAVALGMINHKNIYKMRNSLFLLLSSYPPRSAYFLSSVSLWLQSTCHARSSLPSHYLQHLSIMLGIYRYPSLSRSELEAEIFTASSMAADFNEDGLSSVRDIK